MYKNIGVLSMARTAIGSLGGSLKTFSSVELASIVIKEAISRAVVSVDEIDEVIIGCVGQYGYNKFIGRMAALNSGLPDTVTGQTVNRMCASGLQAIVSAADYITHFDSKYVVAGGAESMSNSPHIMEDLRWGLKMGESTLKDELLIALAEPFTGSHIGLTAENIADKYKLNREVLDQYSLDSQQKAARAMILDLFSEEIVPVTVQTKKNQFVFDKDEYPRESDLGTLARLRPVFKREGVITAGNASGINDGAAAMVLVNLDSVDVKPLARLIDYSVVGVDPQYMGMGPVPAIRKLLEQVDLKIEDIGLFELNEAFSSQALACINELQLDPAIVNVNGGAIALGHPIGATGTIISMKLINEMRRRKIRYGVVALCIGGGQGMAALFEVNIDEI